ncbi:hypothetical protein EDB92DRAFT_1819856 [Lactarius akahatsu]|uniref:Uncharacterized protein n=1 Tax=Lactarius akahatsu TaxID=416441 RepID=A0AAD4LD86_9AGAM|nr:hypothetical protein EDB92DRAFT_1819856 [Lactarius akahatsu]
MTNHPGQRTKGNGSGNGKAQERNHDALLASDGNSTSGADKTQAEGAEEEGRVVMEMTATARGWQAAHVEDIQDRVTVTKEGRREGGTERRKAPRGREGQQGYAEGLETTGRRRQGREGKQGDASKEREGVALRGQEEEEEGVRGREDGEGSGRVGARKEWGAWVPRMQYEGQGKRRHGEGDGEAKKGCACRADSGMGEKMVTISLTCEGEESVGRETWEAQGQGGGTGGGGGSSSTGGEAGGRVW